MEVLRLEQPRAGGGVRMRPDGRKGCQKMNKTARFGVLIAST